MVKKRILFILGVLDSGGVAKSLVSLVNTVDRSKYDVDLLLVSKSKGPFYELLPKDIRIIQSDLMSSIGNVQGLGYLARHGHILLLLGSILRLIVACVSKPWSAYLLSRLMPAVKGHYDLIVDYNGQQQTYYMVDKLSGTKKVAFFHSDYSKWPYYYKMDKKYYPSLDAIFTISPKCVESLKQFFPSQASKIQLMENISSPVFIENLSEQYINEQRSADTFVLLTVGHICKNKGTDIAIHAAKILKDSGMKFVWYFIGNTAELSSFSQLIDESCVGGCLNFLGLKTNPYPYFKMADIVVHPSLFEGKSVTLDEAKLLCKPIVVTNFSTVNDQFENGVNATIVEMTPEAVAAGIMDLISDDEKREAYVAWLKSHIRDNSSEVEKLYKLLS